jgi:hypothetical protein
MSTRYVQNPWFTDVVTTTDATPTVSAATSYVVPAGVGGYCELTALLRNTSTGAAAVIKVSRSFRQVTGTLTLLGTLISLVAAAGDAGLLTAVLDFTSSGTTFQPRVTGVVATNIEWLLDARYWVN